MIKKNDGIEQLEFTPEQYRMVQDIVDHLSLYPACKIILHDNNVWSVRYENIYADDDSFVVTGTKLIVVFKSGKNHYATNNDLLLMHMQVHSQIKKG